MSINLPSENRPSWFNRHLNWTLLLAWLILIGLMVFLGGISRDSNLRVVLIVIFLLLEFAIAGWVCRRKGGSFWNGIYIMPFQVVAVIIIMILKNQNTTDSDNIESETSKSRFPNSLRVLITLAILAILIWLFAANTQFYFYSIGAGIIIMGLVVYFVYRKQSSANKAIKNIPKETPAKIVENSRHYKAYSSPMNNIIIKTSIISFLLLFLIAGAIIIISTQNSRSNTSVSTPRAPPKPIGDGLASSNQYALKFSDTIRINFSPQDNYYYFGKFIDRPDKFTDYNAHGFIQFGGWKIKAGDSLRYIVENTTLPYGKNGAFNVCFCYRNEKDVLIPVEQTYIQEQTSNGWKVTIEATSPNEYYWYVVLINQTNMAIQNIISHASVVSSISNVSSP